MCPFLRSLVYFSPHKTKHSFCAIADRADPQVSDAFDLSPPFWAGKTVRLQIRRTLSGSPESLSLFIITIPSQWPPRCVGADGASWLVFFFFFWPWFFFFFFFLWVFWFFFFFFLSFFGLGWVGFVVLVFFFFLFFFCFFFFCFVVFFFFFFFLFFFLGFFFLGVVWFGVFGFVFFFFFFFFVFFLCGLCVVVFPSLPPQRFFALKVVNGPS